MPDSLKKLSQARSFREFFTELSYSLIETIAALPLLLFLVAPLLYILRNLFGYWGYEMILDTVNQAALVLGIVAIVLYIGKTAVNRPGIRSLTQEHSSLLVFCVLILLMLLSTAANGFSGLALHGGSRFESLFSYISYILIFFLCGSLIERPIWKLLLFRLMLLAGLVVGILTLLDIYAFRVPMYNHITGVSAIYLHFNHYGYFLTMTLLTAAGCAAFDQNTLIRWCGAVSFVINTVILVINDTFGCYLAVLFGLIFAEIVYFIVHKRINKIFLGFLILYVGISLGMTFWYDTVFRNILTLFSDVEHIATDVETAGYAGNSRWALWTHAVQYISEKPIFGHGVEGIGERLKTEVGCDRPHNEFLQEAAFFGIPAGIVYFAAVFSVYLHGLKYKKYLDDATLVALIVAFGYIISALFGNTTYYVTPLFYMFLGMGFRIRTASEQ